MSYKTRPYIPFLPLLSNPLKEYEISKEFIRISTTFLPDETIALPVAVVRPGDGVFQKLLHVFDRGDVMVNDAGGHFHTLHRIQGAREFMKAVRGATDTTSLPSTSVEDLNPHNLVEPYLCDENLASYVIDIPLMPRMLANMLSRAKAVEETPLVKTGDWIGATHAVYRFFAEEHVGSIIAWSHVAGRVVNVKPPAAVGTLDSDHWDLKTGVPSAFATNRPDAFLISIQPVRGQDERIDKAVAEAYGDVSEFARKFLAFDIERYRSIYDKSDEQTAWGEKALLKEARPRRRKPNLASDYRRTT